MRLLILGATGGTGKALVRQALDRGHEVNVLVRSPEKLEKPEGDGEKLQVIKGSVFEAEDLTKAMTGCQAVVSALGGRPGLFAPCDVYSKSCDVIVSVMKELKINRFISCTAWGTKDVPGLPFVWRWVLKPSFLRNVVADMSVLEDKLLQDVGQDLNWTVVKPPRLTNGPASGLAPYTQEGQLVKGRKNVISRADTAAFMLHCLDTDSWDRKLVAVAGAVPEKQRAGSTAVDAEEKKEEEVSGGQVKKEEGSGEVKKAESGGEIEKEDTSGGEVKKEASGGEGKKEENGEGEKKEEAEEVVSKDSDGQEAPESEKAPATDASGDKLEEQKTGAEK